MSNSVTQFDLNDYKGYENLYKKYKEEYQALLQKVEPVKNYLISAKSYFSDSNKKFLNGGYCSGGEAFKTDDGKTINTCADETQICIDEINNTISFIKKQIEYNQKNEEKYRIKYENAYKSLNS